MQTPLIPKDDPRYVSLNFDGQTFDPPRDRVRLNAQMQKVYDLMKDGAWRSLREIAETIGAPEASVSARLRDLRKPRFGGYLVQRKRVADGLYHYRIAG